MSAPRTAVCTICAKNYLARARTLMASLAEHEPDWERHVLFVDQTEGFVDPAQEDFEVVTDREIGLPNRPHFLFRYELVEANTAVKPWLLATLFRRGFERVVFLDPDTQLLTPLPELVEAHEAGAAIVLTPHLTRPLPADAVPSEAELLRGGTFNLGFLSLQAGETVEAFLPWWQDHLERDCVLDRERGLFVDQKWIDFVPGMYPDVAILRHEGYNVAYWNLPSRRVHGDVDAPRVNDDPLRLLHVSGFDPETPDRVAAPGTQRPPEGEPLATLLAQYATALMEHDHEATSAWPYGYGTTVDGVPLARSIRRLASGPDTELLGPDPFARDAAFFNEPVDADSERGIPYTRAMDALWSDLPALRWLHAEPRNRDRLAYARWFVRHAPEHGLDEAFIGPVRAAVKQRRRKGLRLFR